MIDQKYRLWFQFKQDKNTTESHDLLLKVFGDDNLTVKTCQNWFQRFMSGDESLEDEEHGKRPPWR